MAKTEDAGFTLEADGSVLWQGALAARIANEDVFHPRVTLLGNLGDTGSREAAQKRIETWLTEETGKALRDLKRLKKAVDDGALKGLVRGIAWRLVEAGGVIPRPEVQADLAVLSPEDRRALHKFGVRIGTHAIWLPTLLKPRAMSVARAIVGRNAPRELKGEGLMPAPRPLPEHRLLAAFGRQVVGRYTVPVEMLEDYADQQRKVGRGDLPKEALEALGWSEAEVRAIRSALRPPRRDDSPSTQASAPVAADENSPFAALMGFKVAENEPPAPTKRDKKKKKPKPAAKPAQVEGEVDATDAATDPAKKKRRRRRGKGGAGEGQTPAQTEATADSADGTDAIPSEASTEAGEPKKKRRRRRKSKGEAASAIEGQDSPVLTEAASEPGSEPSTDLAATPAEPARKKRRRRRKPKGEPKPAAEGETSAESQATVEASPSTIEDAGDSETKPKRRRSRRRKPKGEASGDAVTASQPQADAPVATSEPSCDDPA